MTSHTDTDRTPCRLHHKPRAKMRGFSGASVVDILVEVLQSISRKQVWEVPLIHLGNKAMGTQ
jgi:hypothetical protein